MCRQENDRRFILHFPAIPYSCRIFAPTSLYWFAAAMRLSAADRFGIQLSGRSEIRRCGDVAAELAAGFAHLFQAIEFDPDL